jgi:uroporphyrinogen-III decarboxylase
VTKLLPTLIEIGFDAVHPTRLDQHDLRQVQRQARNLALIGGMPTSLLAHGDREEIKQAVADCYTRFGRDGGYVLSSSTGILGDIPPENLVTMTRAVQRFGRYDSAEQTVFERDRLDAKELVT